MASGTFTLRDGMTFAIPTEPTAARAAVFLVELLRTTRGIRLKPLRSDVDDAAAPLRFRLLGAQSSRDHVSDELRDPESYAIDISPEGVTISSSDARGLLYGAVTVWQLCGADPGMGGAVILPAMRLTDWPRFKWRALLLDSARHYQSPAFIMQLLDWMALHKLNVLHWHLTDDQAWRLQIRKYPRLTDIGAWRVPAGAAAAADIDPATHRPRLYGGFYSQQVVRQIVAHAAERNITVVPEIEMPGHATAALVAYPQLATDQPAPTAVPSDWGIYPNLYNAEEATFRFLEDVLTEVMALFPSRYIHIGGDEALKDQWQGSARIGQRRRELGLSDPDALQGYFVSRMGRFLAARGRRVMGWDEILAAQIPADAAVTSWRGVQGGISAARAGHEVVLAPEPQLYFDYRQGDLPDEPPGRGRIVSLEEVYRFEPLPQILAPLRSHVLGVQANIWTEHMRTEQELQTMLFPRAAALAEMGWSSPANRDWTSFSERLTTMQSRYDLLGIRASPDAFAVRIDARLGESVDQAEVTLSKQAAAGAIHYTLDGREPTPQSAVYTHSFSAPVRGTVHAAVWVQQHRPVAATARALDPEGLLTRSSAQLRNCSDKVLLYLEDDAPSEGPRAKFLLDILDPCWIFGGVNLTHIRSISATVGQLPFNFQLGAQAHAVVLSPARQPAGELDVRLDRCDGEIVASLSLQPAQDHPAVTQLPPAALRAQGVHDLCLKFSRPSPEPTWALDRVTLLGADVNGVSAARR